MLGLTLALFFGAFLLGRAGLADALLGVVIASLADGQARFGVANEADNANAGRFCALPLGRFLLGVGQGHLGKPYGLAGDVSCADPLRCL